MIRVTVKLSSALRSLDQVRQKQIPFATAKALNETALNVQKAERAQLEQGFKLRRRDWAFRNIKINRGDFATKSRLRAIVRIESPGGGARSDILGKFEDGGIKRPRMGSRIAIPGEVQRTKTGIVSKGLRPSALNFRPVGGNSRSNVMKGDKRTFLIRKPGGRGVILQRTGRGKRAGVRVLFFFRPSVRIDRRLRFHDTAVKTVQDTFNRNFGRAFAEAIRTAR